MITHAIEKALTAKIGCVKMTGKPTGTHSIANQFFIYETEKGTFFVKTRHGDNIEPFAAEAVALQLIDETKTVRVPLPHYYGYCDDECFLILEYIELFPHTDTSMALLGEQLANLHLQKKEKRFGFGYPNLVGPTPQLNDWHEDWGEFFRIQRLEPQLELIEFQYQDKELLSLAERLFERMPSFFQGINVTPSLLHGDLWVANTATDKEGTPLLFDPASYYGHHEVDLSLMELFGGFSPSFFEAYHRLIPKEEGFLKRQQLYRLYPLLNHYNLFGKNARAPCINTIFTLLDG